MCFLTSYSLLYSNSIMITNSSAFHLFSSCHMFHKNSWNAYPPDIYFCISKLYACAIALLCISYLFLQQQKLTEWDRINTLHKKLYFSLQTSCGSACTLSGECLPQCRDYCEFPVSHWEQRFIFSSFDFMMSCALELSNKLDLQTILYCLMPWGAT